MSFKPEDIFIIVGCEESQAICEALRALGFMAFSCDLQKCSGGHPEWHFVGDVFEILQAGFLTLQTGEIIYIKKWHAGIFNPPCKFLAFSGERWRTPGIPSYKKGHFKLRLKALAFFKKLCEYPLEFSALENSYSVFIHRYYRVSDQKIQPYYFGHTTKKETHFWLNNLPPLMYNYIVQKDLQTDEIHKMPRSEEREKLRSKTFPNIAKAIAEQWGSYILNEKNK